MKNDLGKWEYKNSGLSELEYLARLGYTVCSGKLPNCPPWEELTEYFRRPWYAVAKALREEVLSR